MSAYLTYLFVYRTSAANYTNLLTLLLSSFDYRRIISKSSINSSIKLSDTIATMLDVSDFISERGGDLRKVRESQRRRNAPESAVDDVIALYEDHRKSMPSRPHFDL